MPPYKIDLCNLFYHFLLCFIFSDKGSQPGRILWFLFKFHGWRGVLWSVHPCCPLPVTMKRYMMDVDLQVLSILSLVAGTTTWVRNLFHSSDVEALWINVISSWPIRPTKSTTHHRQSGRSGSEYGYISLSDSHLSLGFSFIGQSHTAGILLPPSLCP